MEISKKPLTKIPLLLLVVWLLELMIMFALNQYPRLHPAVEALIDASTLILLSSYPVWALLIKPLMRHLERRVSLYETAISEFEIIGETDANGMITYVNDRFCEISKYSRKELIGKTHRIIKSGVHDKAFFKEMWSTITSGKTWKGQICNRAKDGTLYWVDAFILPFFNDDGKIEGYYAVRHDITQLKELTEKEKEQSARMAQSVKMASLGEMAGGIAHEINNPLAVITGKAQLVQRMIDTGKIDSEKMSSHIQAINRTVEKISDIIKGLRNFSRDEGEVVPFKNVKIKEVIEDTLNLCQARMINNGVKLIVPEIPEHLRIDCRPTQISQVILNLLNNAFDAVQTSQDKWISVDVGELGDDIVIRVTDSGTGIPESIRNKIMQPFFTTKPVGKGTGLGLSVSLGIMKSHKGSLVVDAESKNTSFVLRFPKMQTS